MPDANFKSHAPQLAIFFLNKKTPLLHNPNLYSFTINIRTYYVCNLKTDVNLTSLTTPLSPYYFNSLQPTLNLYFKPFPLLLHIHTSDPLNTIVLSLHTVLPTISLFFHPTELCDTSFFKSPPFLSATTPHHRLYLLSYTPTPLPSLNNNPPVSPSA